MRRHIRMKTASGSLCVFCAQRLGPATSMVHGARRPSTGLQQQRGLRASARSDQYSETASRGVPADESSNAFGQPASAQFASAEDLARNKLKSLKERREREMSTSVDQADSEILFGKVSARRTVMPLDPVRTQARQHSVEKEKVRKMHSESKAAKAVGAAGLSAGVASENGEAKSDPRNEKSMPSARQAQKDASSSGDARPLRTEKRSASSGVKRLRFPQTRTSPATEPTSSDAATVGLSLAEVMTGKGSVFADIADKGSVFADIADKMAIRTMPRLDSKQRKDTPFKKTAANIPTKKAAFPSFAAQPEKKDSPTAEKSQWMESDLTEIPPEIQARLDAEAREAEEKRIAQEQREAEARIAQEQREAEARKAQEEREARAEEQRIAREHREAEERRLLEEQHRAAEKRASEEKLREAQRLRMKQEEEMLRREEAARWGARQEAQRLANQSMVDTLYGAEEGPSSVQQDRAAGAPSQATLTPHTAPAQAAQPDIPAQTAHATSEPLPTSTAHPAKRVETLAEKMSVTQEEFDDMSEEEMELRIALLAKKRSRARKEASATATVGSQTATAVANAGAPTSAQSVASSLSSGIEVNGSQRSPPQDVFSSPAVTKNVASSKFPTSPRKPVEPRFDTNQTTRRRPPFESPRSPMKAQESALPKREAPRASSPFGGITDLMRQGMMAGADWGNMAQEPPPDTPPKAPYDAAPATMQSQDDQSPEGSSTTNNSPRSAPRSASTLLPFDPELTPKWSIIKHPARDMDTQFAPRLSSSSVPNPAIETAASSGSLDNPFATTGPTREVQPRLCRICKQPGHIAFFCPQAGKREPLPKGEPEGNGFEDIGGSPSTSPSGTVATASQGNGIVKSAPSTSPPETTATVSQGMDAFVALLKASKKEDVSEKAHRRLALDDNLDEDNVSPGDRFTAKGDDQPESRITMRSNRFADSVEDEVEDEVEDDRAQRKPRRRSRDEDEDLDDEKPRRRRAQQSFMGEEDGEANEEEYFGARQTRRRRADDVKNEDELLNPQVQAARDKRQREREERQAKAYAEEQRKRSIAAQRAQAVAKITLPQFITVSNLAQALDVKLEPFQRRMASLGFWENAHDYILTSETSSLIALEYNFDPVIGSALEVQERDLKPRPELQDKAHLAPRPPIVTIMGHVDHGKTTILDFLRKSSVVATEHGGITQHIGAFSVAMSGGRNITFLDTPGHAAFLSMRKRGANVTDMVVLVVAADDSVKPQTLEALKHAREANVPIIVAINKVDKPEANIQNVKNDLARRGVEIEDFGGEVQVVPVSGKTGQGMSDLEEAIVALGELLDHRAETTGMVEGWIIEATTKAAGRVATVLVRRGTLRSGDVLVAGQTWTKVKTLKNEAGVEVEEASPGTPVEVDGWREQPVAGDLVLEAVSEHKATDVVDFRVEVADRAKLTGDVEAINEARKAEQERREEEKRLAEAKAAGEEINRERADRVDLSAKQIPFIIKADVSGSAEAVEAYLQQLVNPLMSPRILRSAVGPISEFDVEHAAAAKGHIISFNLGPPAEDIAGLAQYNNVKVLQQNVIYRLLEQVKSVLEDKLEPIKTQRVTGEAEVVKPFDIGIGGRRKMRIAGSRVKNGEIKRNSRVRVLRRGEKVYDGTISSLKNVKKDVMEMRKGTECGIGFDTWTDAQEGDQIQTYEEIEEKRRLQI